MIGDMIHATPADMTRLARVVAALPERWRCLSLDDAAMVQDLCLRTSYHPAGGMPVTSLEMDRLREIEGALLPEGGA